MEKNFVYKRQRDNYQSACFIQTNVLLDGYIPRSSDSILKNIRSVLFFLTSSGTGKRQNREKSVIFELAERVGVTDYYTR